ncbi:HD-GYP domain-containing protein [Salinibacillus xinjiangensis]|uniref:HD-GYP domain-containing protein n=1 Tax=Salinibacillus xinjiangensis TaxID=1229268 RepID=UPI0018916412|nr:HD-GYP domain-containing protein [Salinibacillus xinjiangensis]
MRVEPNQLKPGCVVMKNVVGKTMKPILPKDTVIKPIHINVLKHFQIKEIEVANTFEDGEEFKPELMEQQNVDENQPPQTSFIEEYETCVLETKQMFKLWQERSPIDYTRIRELLIPIVLKAEGNPKIIFSLHHLVEKEDYFYHHFVAKALISAFLAQKLNYSQGERIQIALAAYLSDVGMAYLDEQLLYKNARLTEDEFKQVKNHPVYSYRKVENIKALKYDAKIAILQHHERLDGSGYPLGLKQPQIHLYSKIIAVSDVFHAITSERLYKQKQSPFKVAEDIQIDQAGKLDFEVVNKLVQSLSSFSNGTRVRLSDGREGEIVFMDKKEPTRPIVRLGHNDEMMVLKQNPQLHIEDILL